ncbi:MAG: hypothetical protein HY865_14515 [Chloroflexi bacterium]|nr:hypothetical protein [Chloroflexota bacterium]
MTRFPRLASIGILLVCMSAACSLQTPPPQASPPPADSMATSIALGVIAAQSQTAQALPTATATQTPPPPPTFTGTPTQQPVVTRLAPCWFGPGPAYRMESSIKEGEIVELLAVGTVPGWYIIRNPYFQQPCWIQAENLSLDPAFDPSQFPMVTPLPTRIKE